MAEHAARNAPPAPAPAVAPPTNGASAVRDARRGALYFPRPDSDAAASSEPSSRRAPGPSAETRSAERPARLFRIDGMWCPSCARAVEKRLQRADDTSEAQVSFATRTAVVQSTADEATVADRIAALGYRAVMWRRAEGIPPLDPSLLTDVAVRLAVAVFFTMWVMVLQVVLYVGALSAAEARLVAAGAGVFASAVVLGAGARIHLAAWRTLRAGAPGMDALISLGALTAWTLSVARLAGGSPEGWFDTAAMLITLLLAGRLLDARVRARGDAAIREAMRPANEPTTRVVDGVEARVSAGALAPGDRVVARGGEELVVDGVVVEGEGTLDQAALTGESIPVELHPGAPVFAGGRIVRGEVHILADAVLGGRRVDRIREQVRQALDQRAELLSTADRFVERLVPAVLAIAAATGGATWLAGADPSQALLRMVAVLVVTCPCALGLATPLVLSLAVSRAARRGMVFRTFDALERLAEVDTVVFDKTGTLTEGRLQVEQVTVVRTGSSPSLRARPPSRPNGAHGDGRARARAASSEGGIEPPAVPARAQVPAAGAESEGAVPAGSASLTARVAVLAAAASSEWGVEHPVADALRAAAGAEGLALEPGGERTVEPGGGVTWQAPGGETVWVGAPAWVDRASEAHGGPRPPPTGDDVADGCVVVRSSAGLEGRITLRDALRAEAPEVVQALRNQGFDVRLWSGDRSGRVAEIAERLDIADARCAMSPEDKAAAVATLAAANRKIAFVGDGVNDAPALSRAHVGVAADGAADAAVAVAPVVLQGGGVGAVGWALDLARRARALARQNLGWAVAYNLSILPLAALGYVTPVVGALAMLASSLSVTLNALRITRPG